MTVHEGAPSSTDGSIERSDRALDRALDRATDRDIAAAYSATAATWRDGPGPVYERLAVELLRRSPVPVRGASVLDIGAGTGAASAAARRAGAAQIVAVDAAPGILAVDRDQRPPAVVGDAAALPFASGSFDVAVAAFSLNHLADPAAGLREAARVVRPGGAVVASAYAADDSHPVKRVTESVLSAHGWEPEAWQLAMYADRAPLLADEASCQRALVAADLRGRVDSVRVGFPELSAAALVRWRLGMAQYTRFLDSLGATERAALADQVVRALGPGCPPLVRSITVITAPR